ncbi:MAG TPA: ABC transporter permease [Puia sp.]|nr:ABC transporter permease [Puia sp.]
MLRTLKIEWMKVKNYRTFWILLGITTVSIPAFNYSFYDLTDNSFPKIKGQSIFGTPFSFPDVWQTVSFNSSLLLFIPAILIITLTCNEFTYRTHRQNIIDGWSRHQFINIKLLEVLLFSIFVTGIVFITALLFGHYVKQPNATVPVFQDVRFIAFFFVEMLSYSLIAFLFSMLIKRAGLSMGIFFIYLIIEQFVVALGRNKFKKDWVDYLPEEVVDMLIPQPYARKLMGQGKLSAWEHHIPTYLAVGAAYLLLYILLTSWRFRKTDL